MNEEKLKEFLRQLVNAAPDPHYSGWGHQKLNELLDETFAKECITDGCSSNEFLDEDHLICVDCRAE